MISPLRNLSHPFKLPSNIIYFHDWRYVHHGTHSTGWRNQEGEWLRIWSADPVPPLRHDPGYMPMGIRLRAKPAIKSDPILLAGEDEGFIFAGVMMHDEERYRWWYESMPAEHITSDKYAMGDSSYVRYAESDDGQDWRFPSLGQIERKGTKENNIVYGPPIIDAIGLHGPCVFKDPSAPPEERYKMLHTGHLTPEMKAQYLKERPDEVGSLNTGDRWDGLFGVVSPDGISWTPLPDPLVAQISDTHNVCEYDPVLGQYVAYVRNHFFARRTIGRSSSEDFRRLPLSEDLFWPGTLEEPYDLWYTAAKTKMPGTTDYHIMFPLRWRLIDDSFSFVLAASPDNILWSYVPGDVVCEPGDGGDWVAGAVAPGVGMVNLPGNKMGIPIVGSPEPHKHLRQPPHGHMAWATWPRGRLVGLEAPVEGSFRTFPLETEKRSIHLNFKTPPGGYVQVQANDRRYQPLPGRSFDDCDWLIGDQIDRQVSWKGETDLGYEAGQPLSLSFRLRCAELYSIEFK